MATGPGIITQTTQMVGRPFPQVVSGNPSGRPAGTKGFAAYIEEQTLGGKPLQSHAYNVNSTTTHALADATVEELKAMLASHRAQKAVAPPSVVLEGEFRALDVPDV